MEQVSLSETSVENVVPKRKIRNFLLIIIASTILFNIYNFVSFFLQGYDSDFMILPFVWIFPALTYLVILIVCLIKSVKWAIKAKQYWPLPLACLFCLFIGIWRPYMYADPMFLGAKYSLSKSDPEKIIQEGIALMKDEKYRGKKIMLDKIADIAPYISKINPLYIGVEKNIVTIKTWGMFGDFGGFIITLDPKEQHGKKIIDGLYWVQSHG